MNNGVTNDRPEPKNVVEHDYNGETSQYHVKVVARLIVTNDRMRCEYGYLFNIAYLPAQEL